MTIKENHKYVTKEIGTFLTENGFVKQGTRSWAHCTDEMIQMVILNFSYGQEKFDLDVVIQPWCIPEKGVYLTLSSSLSKIDSRSEYRSWGTLDGEKIIDDINDCKAVMAKDMLPLLKSCKSCLSSLAYIDASLSCVFRVDAWDKSRTFAYILFYKHKAEEATQWAEKYLALVNNYSNEDIETDIHYLKQLLLFSKERDSGKIDELFKEIIENNRQKFKLKC